MRYYYIQLTDEGTQVGQTMSTVHTREVTKAQFVFSQKLQNALIPVLQLSEVCEKNPVPAVWNYPAWAGTHPEPSLFYNTNTIKTWSLCIQQAKGVCVYVLNRVQLFLTSWRVAGNDPLSMGFSRQERWRRLPFPSPVSFQPMDWTSTSCIGMWVLYCWAAREPLGNRLWKQLKA